MTAKEAFESTAIGIINRAASGEPESAKRMMRDLIAVYQIEKPDPARLLTSAATKDKKLRRK